MRSEKNNKLQSAKNRRVVFLFFATFFLSMFIVGFLIKTLSPNVDVEIGDDLDSPVSQDESSEAPKNVDDRLKWIQFEDNMPGVSKRFDTKENVDDITYEPVKEKKNERVREPEKEPQDIDVIHLETDSLAQKLPVKNTLVPVPSRADVAKQVSSNSDALKMTKIYVGYYSTIEQAIAIQNKIADSNLNISPFVKEVNGYYVVQAGSYANRQKAQSLYSQIVALGFPARMASE